MYAEESHDWYTKVLKVKNPNELAFFTNVYGDCGKSAHDINEVIRGVMIRSRIKPDYKIVAPVYLNTRMSCFNPVASVTVDSIDVTFARYAPESPILYDVHYASIGQGPEDYVLNKLKEHIEQALTDYIKANFDL